MFYIALAAAATCAICNGVAAILQKVSASKAKPAHSLNFGLMWQLVHDPLYSISIVLDLIAGAGELFSVRFLPLFLVQSIVAASVVVTALIDRFVLKHHMRRRTYAAVALVLVGLMVLGAASEPATRPHIRAVVRWIVVFGPLALAAAGLVLARLRSATANVGLALLSGLAFGGTAISGRIISFNGGLWVIAREPLTFSVVAYAVLGLLLFTLAVQRGSATIMNAAMVSTQTLLPTLVGLLLLGDDVRGDAVFVVVAGCSLTLIGAFSVMVTHKSSV
jgi:hypothetical protein